MEDAGLAAHIVAMGRIIAREEMDEKGSSRQAPGDIHNGRTYLDYISAGCIKARWRLAVAKTPTVIAAKQPNHTRGKVGQVGQEHCESRLHPPNGRRERIRSIHPMVPGPDYEPVPSNRDTPLPATLDSASQPTSWQGLA